MFVEEETKNINVEWQEKYEDTTGQDKDGEEVCGTVWIRGSVRTPFIWRGGD